MRFSGHPLPKPFRHQGSNDEDFSPGYSLENLFQLFIRIDIPETLDTPERRVELTHGGVRDMFGCFSGRIGNDDQVDDVHFSPFSTPMSPTITKRR